MIQTERIEEDPAMFEIKQGERFMETFDQKYREWCRRRDINPDEETFRAKAGRPRKVLNDD